MPIVEIKSLRCSFIVRSNEDNQSYNDESIQRIEITILIIVFFLLLVLLD